MKQLYFLAFLLLGALAGPAAHAQTRPVPQLRLASGTVTPAANFATWSMQAAARPAAREVWANRYYRLLQFDALPTESQKAELARLGVQLLQYLPDNAWVSTLPVGLNPRTLRGFGIRSVLPVEPRWKLAGEMAEGVTPAHALRGGGLVEVVVQHHSSITQAEAARQLILAGYRITARNEFSAQLTLVCPATAPLAIAALPWVASLEYVPAPAVPENQRARTDHRANVLSTDYGAGRKYDGTGVNIAHGDDGAIGPHIDYQGRFDQSSSGPDRGTHGDHVAGIIMGAGNLNPRQRGQATGAFNYYYDYPNNINSITSHYTTRNIRVTSSSYGQTCNAGYTSDARSMDQQTRQMPLLLHVFSAGNSGATTCGYGASGAGWGTITGGLKAGKNVITVGNVDHTDVLSGSSSRGPVKDGRIKPEICAVGSNVTSTINPNTYDVFSGTSMACPGVSGVLAQLIQAYRSLNAGAEAPGALLKASLMNTAEDLGTAGPDFRFGYGRMNALRAVRVLEDRTYLTNTITQGQALTHTITVPAGKKQLRVMLYWHDYEGAANAAVPLVNNLDFTLTAPGNVTYQPWVLNPAPTAVAEAAVRGTDNLNNSEQVTLNDPAAGTYTFTVNGTAVPQGPQSYYITYSYIEDGVELTHPIGGEAFVPAETEVIRWDAATNGTGTFSLDYSTNGGSTWTAITTGLSATTRHYNWTVPSVASGQVRVRVTRGAASNQSAANFTIAGVPTGIQFTSLCSNSTTLQWTAVSGATSYEVLRLGTKYMDVAATVTGTSAQVPATAGTEEWYSVRALGANGLRGQRAVAVRRAAVVATTCGPPVAFFTSNTLKACTNIPLTLIDQSAGAPITAWNWSVSPSTGVSFVEATTAASASPRVQFSQPGTYSVSLSITNALGSNTLTHNALITVTRGAFMPVVENFAAFPPAGWEVRNPAGITWQHRVGVMGPTGSVTAAAWVNNYDYDNAGAEDYLLTKPVDLRSRSLPKLEFWVSYAQYNAQYSDALRVDISTDCGQTFQPAGYLKAGAALATATATTASYTPTLASQWRKETLDLTPFTAGTAGREAILRFTNITAYGNNLYLADARVTGTGPLPVTLAALSGQWRPDDVRLRWATANEKDAASFDVERSSDGQQWKVVGNVRAAGNSSSRREYAWTDADANYLGTNQLYYQLRQLDEDGTAHLSPVVTVYRDATTDQQPYLAAYPVPFTNALNVEVALPTAGTATLVLVDALGREVRRQELPAATGLQQVQVPVTLLPAGVYTLRLQSASGARQLRVIK
ncbi:S8 family serine peptidase [Hymenobacter koreensis]|uniref:PKD domain-containing protein n=1 Tax=Hymenobacter koreensis TaxID=1084523 RepID=A0ABP8JM73_9BACT